MVAARRRGFWGLVRGTWLGTIGILIVLCIGLLAVAAPLLLPYDPVRVDLSVRLQPPSLAHALGTDEWGRDIFHRLAHGARISLLVGTVTTAIAVVLGAGSGAVAGFRRGWIDNVIMRSLEVVQSFPPLLLAIAVMAALGTSIYNAMLAIGIVYTPYFARVARASVASVSVRDYVEASRAVGASEWRILVRHVAPNSLAPVVVQAALGVANAVLMEATLSFLGLSGVQPPQPSWGVMLNSAHDLLREAPWYAVFTGLAIMLTVLGFNLAADGLRDYLDPTTRTVS